MKEIIYRGAINSLSFGNVSYNLMREISKSGIKVSFFPFGDKLDFSAFDKIDEDFKQWVVSSSQERFNTVDKEMPCLTQWHINGSENKIGKSQTLFTFHETDEVTSVEKSIVNLQDACVFSSNHSKKIFQSRGCQNVSSASIGFDQDFESTGEEYLPDKIHFGLMGKFEKRKQTGEILKAWVKKYGNDYRYQLSCCINNPFFKPDQMNQIIAQTLDNKVYGNVNFLPHLKTNSEVNEFLNAIDIDLTGLSGAEGWNIPAFNSTALGKWSIVMNHTSHKDWATNKNSILIEPDSSDEIYDGSFFIKGHIFNQGNMNFITEDKMINAFETAEKKCKSINKEGLKLQEKFTYSKTLKQLLKTL